MTSFFDLLIAISLIASILPAFILLKNLRKDGAFENRHKKITFIIIFLLLFAGGMTFYGSFAEPNKLVVNKETIALKNLGAPLKAALVADFQVGPYKKTGFVEKVVNKILAENPDVVFIAGDHVNNVEYTDETKYLAPLEKLASAVPTYAIPGNHEYGLSAGITYIDPTKRTGDVSAEVKTALEKMGIKYLTNDLETISIAGAKFYLFGGEEYWSGKLNYKKLKTRTEKIPTIAMIHTSVTAYDLVSYDVDLLLSGHTHGGQIRLPLIGPLGRVEDNIPTEWYKGLIQYKGLKIFTTSGVGETGARVRLFNPPEIVILNLIPKK